MKRRKSNLATNQKCQGYQPKMSIIPSCRPTDNERDFHHECRGLPRWRGIGFWVHPTVHAATELRKSGHFFATLTENPFQTHPGCQRGTDLRSSQATECCHGSSEWDDDSKNRPKCCHGSKEWDDNSSIDLWWNRCSMCETHALTGSPTYPSQLPGGKVIYNLFFTLPTPTLSGSTPEGERAG